jgi:hypothetical protein
LGGGAQFYGPNLTRFDLQGGFELRLSGSAYSAVLQQLLQVTPGKLGHPCHQHPIKSLAMKLWAHDQFPQLS